nr:acyltransferase [Jeotgalibacillus malaysiensis]
MKKIFTILSDGFIRNLHPGKLNCRVKKKLLTLRGSRIGENLFLDIGVIIRSPNKMEVGSNVVISCYTVITAGGGLKIEDNVMIGYNCNILTQNHIIPHNISESIRFSGHKFDAVHIKKEVWIAANVTVLPGVTIGEGAVIAAGATVTKDVEPYSIYAGTPAKKIRSR